MKRKELAKKILIKVLIVLGICILLYPFILGLMIYSLKWFIR